MHDLLRPYTSLLDSDSWHVNYQANAIGRFSATGQVEMAPCFSTTPGAVQSARATASSQAVIEIGDRDAWCHLAVADDLRANSVTYYKNGRWFVRRGIRPLRFVPLVFGLAAKSAIGIPNLATRDIPAVFRVFSTN